MRNDRWIPVILLGIFVITCGYNACGPSSFHAYEQATGVDLSSVTGDSCTVAEKEVYAQTYFPLLSVSCNKCHSDAHGSTDINVSFNGFEQYGKTLIDYQATHPHEGNGVDLTTEIAGIQDAWAVGQTAYQQCVAASGVSSNEFTLSEKTAAVTTVTTVTPATATAAAITTVTSPAVTMTWDLDADVPQALQNQVHGILSANVAYAIYQNKVVGFVFSNFSIKTKGSGSITVGPMHLYLDGQEQQGLTEYATLANVISSLNNSPLIPGAGSSVVGYPTASPTTKISFSFDNLSFTAGAASVATPTPAPVTITYDVLISTDSTSILTANPATAPAKSGSATNCLNCHRGDVWKAGILDFADYTVASANAKAMITAVSGAAPTMPMNVMFNTGMAQTPFTLDSLNLEATKTDPTLYRTMTWDMDTDANNVAASMNQMHVIVSAQVRYHMDAKSGLVTGLDFKNITATNKGGGSAALRDLQFNLVKPATGTTAASTSIVTISTLFNGMETVVNPTSPPSAILLDPANAVATATIASPTGAMKIGFRLSIAQWWETKGAKLSATQISILQKWIDNGTPLK